jgi:hypothetical protein
MIDQDDSGDEISGSVHDNAWLQRLFDVVDARWSYLIITATGTVNDLQINEADLLIFQNAADLTVTGILAPSSPAKNGKPLRMICLGAGAVYLPHQSGLSSGPNRFNNWATSAPTPIYKGAAIYTYAGTWILTAHEQGAWITSPYNASNFYGNGGMVVTLPSGGPATMRWRLSGRTLNLGFYFTATCAAPLNAIVMVRPAALGGFTQGPANMLVPFVLVRASDSVSTMGRLVTIGGVSDLQFWSADGGPHQAGSNIFQGQMVIEVA